MFLCLFLLLLYNLKKKHFFFGAVVQRVPGGGLLLMFKATVKIVLGSVTALNEPDISGSVRVSCLPAVIHTTASAHSDSSRYEEPIRISWAIGGAALHHTRRCSLRQISSVCHSSHHIQHWSSQGHTFLQAFTKIIWVVRNS